MGSRASVQPMSVASVLFVALFVCVSGARAQTMSYSIYMTEYANSSLTITGYADLQDYGGCASGNPIPAHMEIWSPSRYKKTYNSSTVTMPFNGEQGQWDIVSHFQFTCNCAPYGGSHTFMPAAGIDPWFKITTTYYQNPVKIGEDTCDYQDTACYSGKPTCGAEGIGFRLETWPVCPPFMQRKWLVGVKGASANCLVGIDKAVNSGGTCNQTGAKMGQP